MRSNLSKMYSKLLFFYRIRGALWKRQGKSYSSQVSIETLRRQNADAALAYDFVNTGGYQADIPALRKLHPGLMDFATWLEKTGKTQLEASEHHEQRSK